MQVTFCVYDVNISTSYRHKIMKITSTSLMDFAGPVYNQGNIGYCQSTTGRSAMDLIAKELHIALPPLSALGLYNDSRERADEFNVDGGVIPQIMFEQMKVGIPTLASFSDNPSNFYVHTSAAVDAIAANIKITGYTKVEQLFSATAMKNIVTEYISQGRPILMSYQMHEGLSNENGKTFDQQTGRIYDGASRGGHMSLIVDAGNQYGDGFVQSIGGGVLQNSWGSSIATGNKGFFEFGYQAFFNKQANPGFDSAFGLYVIDGISVNGVEHNLVWSEERKTVALGYVALLDRAPDATGLDWWSDHVKQGMTGGELYDNLLMYPEEQAVYGTLNNAQFVDNIYKNVLGRAPGSVDDGRSFWYNAINETYTRGDVVDEIMQINLAYKDGSNPEFDAVAIHSRDYLENRLDVAMHAAVTYGSDNLDVARVALVGVTDQYDSVTAANHHVWSLLSGV